MCVYHACLFYVSYSDCVGSMGMCCVASVVKDSVFLKYLSIAVCCIFV